MAPGKTTTTASSVGEHDCEEQEHGLSQHSDLRAFRSGSHILASSVGPLGTRASLHNARDSEGCKPVKSAGSGMPQSLAPWL